MYIGGKDFSLKTRTYEIYVSGCHFQCDGCHNPQLWKFDEGKLLDNEYMNEILGYISNADKLIDRIFILGGEPLDQPLNELIYLLNNLKKTGKELWLFTGYDNINDMPVEILNIINYIKCGVFKKNLGPIECFGVTLASSNQNIYKIKL